MKKSLLGGLAAAGMLLGGLAVSGGMASAQDTGDVYTCPAGSTSNYKQDGLNSPTYTVPAASAGNEIVAVIIKASTEHYTYAPVKPGDVIAVKELTGHDASHAHVCEKPVPPVTEPPATEPTVPPVTEKQVPPPAVTEAPVPTPAATSGAVAAAGPVPPAVAPAAATPTALPSTGSSSWGLALAALASLMGGLGLVKLSRRTS